MSNFNRVIMIGNLTREPDYKQLPSGQPVARLSIASNRHYKNRQTGALVQEVCFIDVDVFGPQAENCRQYLQKGRPVLIEGRLKFDSWQTPDGQSRSKHSIVADRVVFLQQAANTIENDQNVESSSERLGSDISAAIKLDAQSLTTKKSTSTPDADLAIVFKDEVPFPDELPF